MTLIGASRNVEMTRRLLLSVTASIFCKEWSHALSDPQLKVQQQAPFALGYVERVSLGEMSAATPFVFFIFRPVWHNYEAMWSESHMVNPLCYTPDLNLLKEGGVSHINVPLAYYVKQSPVQSRVEYVS